MSFLFTLIDFTRFFDLPEGLTGWLGWAGMLAALLGLLWHWRGLHPQWRQGHWVILGALLGLTPLTSLLLGLRLPESSAAPLLDISLEPGGPALMLLSAIPWAAAAGLLGPAPAALLAAISGGIYGYFDTHSLFTPLEYGLLAALLSFALRQRYRTPFYRALRHPLLAAASVVLIYPLIHVIASALFIEEPFVISLSYAVAGSTWPTAIFAAQMLVGAVAAWGVAARWPGEWYGRMQLRPSPTEVSLEGRFIYRMLPLGLVFFILLVVGAWSVAGRLAEQLLRDRLEDVAAMAAESIPVALETGQNLAVDFANDPRLYILPTNELGGILEEHLRAVPYFNELLLWNTGGQLVATTAESVEILDTLPAVERQAISLALEGISFQMYASPPREEGTTAQLSFVAAVLDDSGRVQSVLLARSSLDTNPYLQPVIENLARFEGAGGSAFLLDSDGAIIYHSLPELLMTPYGGAAPQGETAFERVNYRGTYSFLNYQRVLGRDWAVVTTLPVEQAQLLAFSIAGPLLAVLLSMVGAAFIALRIGLRAVNASLKDLVAETNRIAGGDLERPLTIEGVDEIGQLRAAFERMRLSLKERLDEINRLLSVSQGVASTLELEEVIRPVLEAALTTGASASRLVLSSFAVPEDHSGAPPRYGFGPSADKYGYLDEQILTLTRQQNTVELRNPSRAGLQIKAPNAPPGALLAIGLRHDNANYGALWVAFDQPHQFTETEVRFVSTVANQAAMAAGNARLYRSAQLGRRRLESILASTPDPVLVTDHNERVLLANPAAIQLLGNGEKPFAGLPIERVLRNDDLIRMFHAPETESPSREISFPDGRIFFASVSPILAETHRMGRICVLRDVTNFKELDALKTDMVGMVSNELRAPLALVRGNVKLLQSMGGLNEQQSNYVHKIAEGVEGMSRLVGNLLDLRRIEDRLGLKLEHAMVAEVVRQAVAELRPEAAQRKIEIVVDFQAEGELVAEMDRPLVEQALQNLLSNAIKYSESGDKVQVSVTEEGAGVRISVRDEGIGIAPIDQPHLFERFFRAGGRQTSGQRGSGLGLALVKSVADLHHGKVNFESKLGQGSTFYLFLPYRQTHD